MSIPWRALLIFCFVLIADQMTKGMAQTFLAPIKTYAIIPNFLSLTYVENPGVAFGNLSGLPDQVRTPLLLLSTSIICIWLIYLMYKFSKDSLRVQAYMLIFSGAIGNLIDRISLGHVIDFLDFHIGKLHFPAFNIADGVITYGVLLLFVRLLRPA